MSNNPFIGFRPYKTSEKDIFFGKEKEVEKILSIIQKNKLVILTGPSGSGKSSLINAGVIPRLNNGFIGQSGNKWSICKFRPGLSPLYNLSYSLSSGELVKDKKPKTSDFKNYKKIIHDNKGLGVAKIYKDSEINNNKNLLVIIDQLEDLFVFSNYYNGEALNDDENLLNIVSRTVRLNDTPIYFLVSLKTEYLKHLSSYTNIQEVLSVSQYSIQNIGQDGILKIINETFTKQKIDFEDSLIDNLIKIASKDTSLLTSVQVLFQTFYKSFNKGDTITEENSESLGNLNTIIDLKFSNFYNGLNEEEKIFFETFYKSIFNIQETDVNADFRSINSLLKCSNEGEDFVKAFIIKLNDNFQEKFEIVPITTGFKSKKTFLKPKDVLIQNYIVSQKYKWNKEIQWLEEETKSYEGLITYYNYSENYKNGKIGLLKSPELDLAIKWKNNSYHSDRWSNNYNIDFKQTFDFIKKSETVDLNEKKAKQLELLRKKRARKIIYIVGSIVLIVISMSLIFSIKLKNEADESKLEAEISEKKAVISAKEARDEKDKADEARNDAKENEREAKIQQKVAIKAQKEAEKSANDARKEKEKADKARNDARENEREAKIQQKAAIKAQKEAEMMRKSSDLENEFYTLSLRLDKLISQNETYDKEDKQIEIINESLEKASDFEDNSIELNGESQETESLYVLLQKSLQTLENKESYSRTSMLIGKTADNSAVRSIDVIDKKHITYGGDNGKLFYKINDETQFKILKNERIRSVKFKNNNEILIGTFNGKIYNYNISKNILDQVYSFNTSVKEIFILSSNDIIIISEESLGLLNSKYDFKDQVNIDISSSYYNKENESIYFSSKNIFYSYKNGLKKINLINYELKNKIITSILFFDDYLVLGTKSGEILFYKEDDANNFYHIGKIDLHFTEITKLYYDSTNRILYSSSFDNQLLKYNLFEENILNIKEAKNKHLSLEGHQKWIWNISEYTDNKNRRRLLTIDENGNVISWFLNQENLVDKVKSLLKDRNRTN